MDIYNIYKGYRLNRTLFSNNIIGITHPDTYINTVLQSLQNLVLLTNYFYDTKLYMKDSEYIINTSEKAFVNLYKTYFLIRYDEVFIYKSEIIHRNFKKFYNDCKDPKETFKNFLNLLHKGLSYKCDVNDYPGFPEKNSCILDYFSIVFKNNANQGNLEFLIYIELTLNNELERILNKQLDDYLKRVKGEIIKLPDILVILLSEDHLMTYNEKLILTEYIKNNDNYIYSLNSVIYNDDKNYFSCVKKNNIWYKSEKGNVYKINENEINRLDACVLVYTRDKII